MISSVLSLNGLIDALQLQIIAENLFSDCLHLPHIPIRIDDEGQHALQILSRMDNLQSERPSFIFKPSAPPMTNLSRAVLEYLKPGALVVEDATPAPNPRAKITLEVSTGVTLFDMVCKGRWRVSGRTRMGVCRGRRCRVGCRANVAGISHESWNEEH